MIAAKFVRILVSHTVGSVIEIPTLHVLLLWYLDLIQALCSGFL